MCALHSWSKESVLELNSEVIWPQRFSVDSALCNFCPLSVFPLVIIIAGPFPRDSWGSIPVYPKLGSQAVGGQAQRTEREVQPWLGCTHLSQMAI